MPPPRLARGAGVDGLAAMAPRWDEGGVYDLICLDGKRGFDAACRDFLASLRHAHARTAWLVTGTIPSDAIAALPDENRASAERERLGFTGLRQWVESPEFHLSQLGVNCVELQPVQEFDNRESEEYHWGYMPVNWFAPASAFRSTVMW